MELTLDQVVEMAPDSSSANAGKKLMAVKNWPELGQSDAALWGKCKGSAVYQIKVDLANLGYACSCPSRKIPCKHVLGLLMIAADNPTALTRTDTPDWVDEWLGKRRAREAKKTAEAAGDAPKKPVDEKAQARRAAQRESRVQDGLERLDLWIKDLIRNGIAGLEAKPPDFFDEQARRLVDAQAPGLASRVGRLGEIPGSGRDWPTRMLGQLGRIKLLLWAWQRLADLEPDVQSEVRQLIGWNIAQAELDAAGEKVEDSWAVAAQWIDDTERVRAQRSWLVGRKTGRIGLVLQFAPSNQPFGESIVAGSEQEGTLLFYPGVSRQRAKFADRKGKLASVTERLPGQATIEAFLESVADALARCPWTPSFGAVLHDVTLVPGADHWQVRDGTGTALPLTGSDGWPTLATTGGRAFDLAGEWDGRRLRPLGMFLDGSYRGVA